MMNKTSFGFVLRFALLILVSSVILFFLVDIAESRPETL
jgi:hypothetical protein